MKTSSIADEIARPLALTFGAVREQTLDESSFSIRLPFGFETQSQMPKIRGHRRAWLRLDEDTLWSCAPRRPKTSTGGEHRPNESAIRRKNECRASSHRAGRRGAALSRESLVAGGFAVAGRQREYRPSQPLLAPQAKISNDLSGIGQVLRAPLCRIGPPQGKGSSTGWWMAA